MARLRSQAELEGLREQAVFDFLCRNHGSILLFESSRSAVVQTGGLTWQQVKGHLIGCALTAGLWLPVFAMIAILRAPRQVLIHVTDTGIIMESNIEYCE